MKCRIMHESSGRMRVRILRSRMTMRQADLLEYYLKDLNFVKEVKVYDRTGDAVITYRKTEETRQKLIQLLSEFEYEDEKVQSLVPDRTGREIGRKYQQKLIRKLMGRGFQMLYFPAGLRMAWTVLKSARFIEKGLQTLMKGDLDVSVLDAAAILASMLRRDFSTASSVMFLLDIGELLEEWTYRKSVDELARTISLKVDKVWLRTGEEDVLADVRSVCAGDHIIVRTSNVIPLDGRVLSGEATVNQAAMTGESVPVEKSEGGYVYAGTVVEEGELVIEVSKAAGSGKYDQIVQMIEETEKLKSETETQAYRLADRLVPYSLAGTAITWLLTRNVNRSIAFLMVDFSCALKLSMPLSVLSAIRESSSCGLTVKGGKFLEAVANADTIVFDKTGTLTHAEPKVVQIDTFGGHDACEMLRIAACLEEHYPHSIANAVVEEAKNRNLQHEEMHSEVQYVIAHGIVSQVSGKRVLIGSYHFVFEDEGCTVAESEKERLDQMPAEYSHLYMAIDGELVCVLHIFDPLREEAADVIDQLHSLGFSKICMMTGDNYQTAESIAETLNLDEFFAEVLPEQKAEFIQREHELGRKVVMIGDGINDAPALAEADCGIAVSKGAAIAKEVADIVIANDSLQSLVMLRRLAEAMMHRIRRNYNFIITFNAALILLGVAGILTPAASAMLHNTSTIVTGMRSMSNLLPETGRN